MGEPLKNAFDERVVRAIGAQLRGADPAFPEARFVRRACEGLGALELLDRGRHVARVMAQTLPPDFEQAAALLERSLGPELERTEGNGMTPFLYLPHTMLVAEHGLDHLETSMRLQHALTRRFTAEGSIRPFLQRYPKEVFALLRRWARDPSVHVRRLVSEGTRPRLPWAPRVPALLADPRPGLELLELLKDDPDLYVRRSVANHLNDVAKDHPGLALEVCRRWLEGASEERRWVVRHALRWLVKKGDRGALALLGAHERDGLEVEGHARPRRIVLGDSATATITVRNAGAARRTVVIDVVVHYVKASGGSSPKTFKVREATLGPGEEIRVRKRIAFVERSTRKHRAGRHRIEALVNGVRHPLGVVELRTTHA